MSQAGAVSLRMHSMRVLRNPDGVLGGFALHSNLAKQGPLSSWGSQASDSVRLLQVMWPSGRCLIRQARKPSRSSSRCQLALCLRLALMWRPGCSALKRLQLR